MRYIRTIDGNIVDTSKYKVEHIDICKESDNIEDLFDCYVMKHYQYSTPELIPIIYWEEVKRLLNLTQNNNKVYGAIWTERGLIYVANVSINGEMTLIN